MSQNQTIPPVFVAGSGRSGTTWIGDIISSCSGCIPVFEPLHRKVPQVPRWGVNSGLPGTYLCEDVSYPQWEAFFDALFAGRISNAWTRQDWVRVPKALGRWRLAERIGFRIAKIQYQSKHMRVQSLRHQGNPGKPDAELADAPCRRSDCLPDPAPVCSNRVSDESDPAKGARLDSRRGRDPLPTFPHAGLPRTAFVGQSARAKTPVQHARPSSGASRTSFPSEPGGIERLAPLFLRSSSSTIGGGYPLGDCSGQLSASSRAQSQSRCRSMVVSNPTHDADA